MIYVRQDIPSKRLSKHNLPSDIECLCVEINLRKSKWLLCGTYHPPSQSDKYYFEHLGRLLDIYSNSYEKMLLTGDFNAQEGELCIDSFLYEYNLKNLIKEKTCFKNPENPSCIDLFLTNSPLSFQNSRTMCIGLSDCHKMILTVFKTTFPKTKPKEIIYRNYKTFNQSIFKTELKQKLQAQKASYKDFELTFLEVLNIHAPLKKKVIRANHVPYMSKILRKAIMRRSALENKYRKNSSDENLKKYKKHKSYCSRLYKKERKKYYANLNPKMITDNNKFWTTIKPFLSDKGLSKQNIVIVDRDKIISEDNDVAESLQTFFSTAVDSLGIPENNHLRNEVNENDPIEKILKTYSSHPSIVMIRSKISASTFSFREVTDTEVKKEITNLDPKKAIPHGNIPIKHIKETSEVCSTFLTNIFNIGIKNCTFPDELKLADITPVHKKEDTTKTKNYRPVSVLPPVSKLLEKLMEQQIISYIDKYLSPYLCGYRKGFSTEQALLSLTENWKLLLDKQGYGGAVLMDLSKAFDTLNHDLLIAKLHAYGFDKSSLKLVKSYLTNRWQRTKINMSFSSWSELLKGVPQGSILGPLLFNIYINDLFLIIKNTDICNYADDTTLYTQGMDLNELLINLEHDSTLLVQWFEENYMKLNKEKCHLLVSGHKYEHIWIKINNYMIWENKNVKLLGVKIDSELKFNDHVSNIYKKACRKLTALKRLTKILTLQQRKTLMKSFIDSQFNYCPLIWMQHTRSLNNKINKLQERSLRIVYEDYTSSFDNLLKKDKNKTIHQKNIEKLAIQMYKIKNNIAPKIVSDLFPVNNNYYSLRRNPDFLLSRPKTVSKGTEAIRYLGPKIWHDLPEDIKLTESLSEFKSKIKAKSDHKCPCRLCKPFISNLGFLS